MADSMSFSRCILTKALAPRSGERDSFAQRSRVRGVWIVALIILLALTACGRDEAAAQSRDDADAAVVVTTAPVRAQAWSDRIDALGTARARESVTVTAKVSETVERVHFDSGDEVATGAPLVTLSGRQQQALLEAAQAAAAEAEQLYRRQEQLARQQLIAHSSLDTQRATRDSARARVAQVRADLGDRVIRAPFAGRLGIRQVSPGTLVQPGTAIANLDDIFRVYVDFPVPEAQLANLEPGQLLQAASAAYPKRVFNGTVATIDSRIDDVTRAVIVRGEFPNPDRALRPGMLLQVQLARGERQALVVPEIAVVQVAQTSSVYRVKPDGSVEQVEVQLGGRNAGQVEITKGLRAGDRIVIDGTGKLRPGARIVEGRTRERPRDAIGEAADRPRPAGAAPR
jgi:membrane fusion protein (multidrug efflux system)